jgi:hypothetical protein
MSDISTLSNQYEKLVATSDKINNSVIAFKKQNILSEAKTSIKHPKLKVSSQEINIAKIILLSFLENILKIIEEDYQQSDFIPLPILPDYKEKLSTYPYLKEEIIKLKEELENDRPITRSDIEVLDKILSILDNERSTLFRKLRKARG